jgi:MFS family permease
MSTATRAPERPAAARATLLAGWSLMIIAALHTAVFFPHIPWSEWFGGGLRTEEPDAEWAALFWALPGGATVPGFLLGMLLVRFGRQGRSVGLGVAAALAAWALGCLWLVGPSGFMFFLVTAGLLTAGAILDRRRRRRGARGASSAREPLAQR